MDVEEYRNQVNVREVKAKLGLNAPPEPHFLRSEKDVESFLATIRVHVESSKPILIHGGGQREIPERTDCACRWCVHRFDTFPWVFPIHYQRKTDTYHVKGFFCSANCAKAYLIAHTTGMGAQTKRLTWFADLARRIYGLGWKKPIHAAPPPECLELFGGPMSIEKFRKESQVAKFRKLEWPVQLIDEVIERQEVQEKIRYEVMRGKRKQKAIGKPIHILKRKKPLRRNSYAVTDFFSKSAISKKS